MRTLALPAALLLGAALYTNLPQTQDALPAALRALHAKIRRLFASKNGETDERSALIVYFLALAAAATLLGALHPIASALVMAPLFSGFSPLPAAAKTKQELDSGKYSKDIPEYERRVLAACRPLGEAFALHVSAPLLLCVLGSALHLSGALGWLYAGLLAVRGELPAADRLLRPAKAAGDGAFTALLLLCAGLVGRNPLRVGGRGAGEKLMHILSLEGEIDHAPISGDILQAIFLCLMSTALLCALATFVGIMIL